MTSLKNDRGGVRTAQELERKYLISDLKQGIKENLYQLQKVNKELEVFVEKTLGDISKLETQIDGKVEAHFYAGVPGVDKIPSDRWENLDAHINDLYYDTDTGISYRFSKTETDYHWNEVDDKETSVALATVNATKDTEDGNIRIFVEQPSPPYKKGDLWLYESEIYICIDEKDSGDFSKGDFTIASNYNERLNVVAKYLTAVRADVGQFKELVSGNIIAINAAITDLDANKATIEDLEALSAYVEKLGTDFLTADEAELIYAKIDSLKALNAAITNLDADKVNVDKANINAAWIVDLLVKGNFLAEDINAAVGSFSQYLTGVNIVGDNITAGTIKTDRLIIRDNETGTGILYEINNGVVNQTGLTAEELKRVALDGAVIVAQSVTADKINVTDLFAQDIISTGNFNMGGNGALSYDSVNDELSIRAKNITIEGGKVATEEQVEKEKTRLNLLIEEFKIAQEITGNVAAYMTFEDGELIIGKSASDVKSVQDNDSYKFVDKAGEKLLEINTKGINPPTVNIEKQTTYFEQWATRKGAYVEGVGYNLNDVWIGG